MLLKDIRVRIVLRGRVQEQTQRSGDTTPRERELLFRLSYPLPYEDEIRSVEGPGRDGGLTDAERHVALTEPLAT